MMNTKLLEELKMKASGATMRRFLKLFIVSVILSLLTSGAFGAGVIFGGSGYFLEPSVAQAEESQPAEFSVFWQVWELTQLNFIDRQTLDPKILTYGAINGLIQALGDEGHTRFLTPEEVARQRTSISGRFFGIGAQVGMEDNMPVIVAPFDGSPAARAGLQSGDIIIEIDHEDVTGLTLSETVERIRGEKGTEVVVTIFRPSINESMEFSIIRDEIKVPAATWNMIPGTDVALIRMSQFSANLHDDIKQNVKEAEAAGATHLIVDVRNNPGGLLEQAVKVTSEFLKDGNVLIQEDATGKREPFRVRNGGVATEIPVTVLINHGSASSAEIFAGAIQDHERGTVIGETTFGTGTVLRPFELEDGSALLLGTSQWLTANGRLIRKQGIQPDIEVELPVGASMITPASLEEMSPADLLASEDTQLLKALELLNALPQVEVIEDGNQLEDINVVK
jgi:carboxyl-terminal processing protease